MSKQDIYEEIYQEIQAWQHFNKTNGVVYKSPKVEQKAFLREQQMYNYPIDVIKKATELYFKHK